jgi:hypothetical protein
MKSNHIIAQASHIAPTQTATPQPIQPRHSAGPAWHVTVLAAALAASAGCGVDAPNAASEPEASTSEQPLVLFNGQSWGRDPNGVTTTLRVCWDPGSTTTGDPDIPMLQNTVRRAVESTWQRNSRVSFVGWGPCTGGEQVTAVITRDGSSTAPFVGPHKFTYLNFSQCGPNPQNKADCVYKTAVHEFGHVLGFVHEQTRSDTPNWCTARDGAADWLISRGLDLGWGQIFGAWDTGSVMNYCNPVWNNDGRLSPTDIRGLQAAYGAPPIPTACQRASDMYGITATITWGFAPPDVRSWWNTTQCGTAPLVRDTCQRMSDLYGTDGGITWGFAPPDVQDVWSSNGCDTHAKGPNACQRASDLYAINPGVSWGYAPSNIQAWWLSSWSGANVQFRASSTCQRISDLYGTDAGVTWGFAPESARTFWSQNNCQTRPGQLAVRNAQP